MKANKPTKINSDVVAAMVIVFPSPTLFLFVFALRTSKVA
jgi:hypothetical protein